MADVAACFGVAVGQGFVLVIGILIPVAGLGALLSLFTNGVKSEDIP
jgi:hypothetical protein